MALVCCRVDESAPYETNVGIPHSHGRIGTRTAGLTGYSEPPIREKNVYRAYTVTCMCELWIVLLVFPMQQIVGSDMMTRVQSDCIVVIFAFLRDVWPGEGGLYR